MTLWVTRPVPDTITTRMRGWGSRTRSMWRKLVRCISGARTKPTWRDSRESRCDALSMTSWGDTPEASSSVAIAAASRDGSAWWLIRLST